MIPQTKIKAGQQVKCELTGVNGLVSSIALEENSNIRIGIQPISNDNKLVEPFFSDEASVQVMGDGIADKCPPLQDTEFAIGQLVGDKYSEFTGHIIMLAWYLNGCVQAVVTSQSLHNGKPVSTSLSTARLNAIEEAPAPSGSQPTGGPITTEYARR